MINYRNAMQLSEVKRSIQSGQIGIMQCDTILGIVGAMTAEVADRIRAVKQRGDDRPFIVLIPSIEYLEKLTTVEFSTIEAVCQEFWPGPLTLVLPKRPEIPDSITGGLPSIGIRLPQFQILNDLLNDLQAPLISTSLNVSGEAEILNVADVSKEMMSQMEFCITVPRKKAVRAVASTVLDCTQSPFRVLREGAISARRIDELIRRDL